MQSPNQMIVCYASGPGHANNGVVQLVNLGSDSFAKEYLEILDLFKDSGFVSLETHPTGQLYTKEWFEEIASWVAIELYGECNDFRAKVKSVTRRLMWLHTHCIVFDAIPNPRGPFFSEWGKLKLGNDGLTVIYFVSSFPTPTVEEIATVLEGEKDAPEP